MRFDEPRRILDILKWWPFVADSFAFGALLSAVLTGMSSLTIVLAAVALLVEFSRHGDLLLSAARGFGPTGRGIASRLLVLAGAVSAAGGSQMNATFWWLAMLLAVCISAEPTLRVLGGRGQPNTWNMPGIEDRKGAPFSRGLVYLMNSAAVVLGLIAAGSPSWFTFVFGAFVVIAIVVEGVVMVDSVTGFRARQTNERILYSKIEALAPTFAVYFNAPVDGSFHVGMWLPFLDRIAQPFILVARNRRNFDDLREITDQPIILRRSREDLDDVIVPSLRAVFYGNLAAKNEHMVWYTHLTHVQMNHGESDKKSSFNPAYKMYDKAFVAGQAGIDRFAAHGVEMPEKAFTIVGRPQVENVEVVNRSIRNVDNKTVLYAPTWAGFHGDVSHCSLPVAHEILSGLLERGCTVIFRPHPFSYRSPAHSAQIQRLQSLLADDAKRNGRQHVYGKQAEKEMTINECFNASDAMVSDVSSVIGDYLFSEKPFAIVAVAAPESEFHESFPVSRAGYIIDAHDGSLHGVSEALDELLGADSLESRRKELRTYYLGDIPSENYAQRFVDEAKAVIRETDPVSTQQNSMLA